MHFLPVLGALAAFAADFVSAGTFSPLRPPAIPLAVSSPYLSTWLAADNLPGTWPTFWSGQITGWQGYISVDGTVYNWMGNGATSASVPLVTQTAFSYTSTRSIFTFNVNNQIQLTTTFLSPVYPNDLIKKSLQYSYVETSVKSLDGATHTVVVYMDISGEWMSGDDTKTIQWDTNVYNNVRYMRYWNPNQVHYQELNQQANWGTIFWGTTQSSGLSYQIGQDTVVRNQFVNNKVLANTVDTNYRAINNDWPVFAYAQTITGVGSTAVSTVFGIGLCQIPTINFQGDSLMALQGQWYTKWSDGIYAMGDWVNGYATEAAYSTTIDNQVYNDAYAAGGADYAALTALAVRQALGGLQPGYSPTKDYMFLKEISSDGDTSTVDVTYPTFPILSYFNATLIKLLLDPLFENQESGNYPNTYAEHDLGAFPNALGYPSGNDEKMPVEECGNMIIMALGYAQKTGDNAYLSQHYTKLQQWAQYLIDDSLLPANQISTDDFAGSLANQTDLALKGIIGIGAMGKIAQLTGNSDTYTATAQSYILQWYGYGVDTAASQPHTTLSYGDDSSWGLLYNLYADKYLGLGLVKQDIYDQQCAWYAANMATYGVILDTRHTYTKLDWEAWSAALCGSDVQKTFYNRLASYAGSTSSRVPLSDLYYTTDATTAGFQARPVVGGLFAQLAL